MREPTFCEGLMDLARRMGRIHNQSAEEWLEAWRQELSPDAQAMLDELLKGCA